MSGLKIIDIGKLQCAFTIKDEIIKRREKCIQHKQ